MVLDVLLLEQRLKRQLRRERSRRTAGICTATSTCQPSPPFHRQTVPVAREPTTVTELGASNASFHWSLLGFDGAFGNGVVRSASTTETAGREGSLSSVSSRRSRNALSLAVLDDEGEGTRTDRSSSSH